MFRGKKVQQPILTQVARQVVKLKPSDLCLPARAWKVKLLGEGADDAGGVFDDTITEMCQVMHIIYFVTRDCVLGTITAPSGIVATSLPWSSLKIQLRHLDVDIAEQRGPWQRDW